jgi:hypothetical protein
MNEHQGSTAVGTASTTTPSGGTDRVAAQSPARRAADPTLPVRTSDVEPYTGLRYLSKLFRLMAIIILLLLIAEVTTGLYSNGAGALPTLLSEVSRLIVLAGLLWGIGDLAILLIDVGHDVRATRILLGRQVAHQAATERAAADRGAADRAPGSARRTDAPDSMR